MKKTKKNLRKIFISRSSFFLFILIITSLTIILSFSRIFTHSSIPPKEDKKFPEQPVYHIKPIDTPKEKKKILFYSEKNINEKPIHKLKLNLLKWNNLKLKLHKINILQILQKNFPEEIKKISTFELDSKLFNDELLQITMDFYLDYHKILKQIIYNDFSKKEVTSLKIDSFFIKFEKNKKEYNFRKFFSINPPQGWGFILDKNLKIKYLDTWTGDWFQWPNEDQKWISNENWARSSFSDLRNEKKLKNFYTLKEEDFLPGTSRNFSLFIYWYNKKKPEEFVPVWWKEKKESNRKVFKKDLLPKYGIKQTTNIATFNLPLPMIKTSWSNFLLIDSLPFWERVAMAKITTNYDYFLGEPSLSYYDENGTNWNVYYDRFVPPVVFEVLQTVLTAGLFSELKLFHGSEEVVKTAVQNFRTAEKVVEKSTRRLNNLRTLIKNAERNLPNLRKELQTIKQRFGNPDSWWDWSLYKGTQRQWLKDKKKMQFLEKEINRLQNALPRWNHKLGEEQRLFNYAAGIAENARNALDVLLNGPQRILTWFQKKLIAFFDWLAGFETLRPLIFQIKNYFNLIMTSYLIKSIGNILGFLLFNNLYASWAVKTA